MSTCYRPLHIKNNIKAPILGVDKVNLTCPCGHCHTCRTQKRLSWFVRSWYEHLHVLDCQGFTYFVTLTYNEDNVPKDFLGNRVFNKKDLQDFLKRLRINISRFYGHRVPLKYLITSEYGGLTHRPHYHALFHVYEPIDKKRFRQFVNDSWNLGFTKAGSRNFGIIDSVGAVHYVSKYICKDMYEDTYFSNLLSLYRSSLGDEEAKKLIRKIQPFFINSTDYGLTSILSVSDYNDLLNGVVLMPDSKVSNKLYKLPLYIERKIFYDTKFKSFDGKLLFDTYKDAVAHLGKGNFTPCYVLNESGCKMKLHRYKKFRESCRSKYMSILDGDLSYINVSHINEKFNTNFSFISQVQDFCRKSFNSDSDYIVDYSLIYKGYYNFDNYDNYSFDFVPDIPLKDYDSRFLCKINRLDLSDSQRQSICFNSKQFPKYADMVLDILDYLYYLSQTKDKHIKDYNEISYISQKSVYSDKTFNYLSNHGSIF